MGRRALSCVILHTGLFFSCVGLPLACQRKTPTRHAGGANSNEHPGSRYPQTEHKLVPKVSSRKPPVYPAWQQSPLRQLSPIPDLPVVSFRHRARSILLGLSCSLLFILCSRHRSIMLLWRRRLPCSDGYSSLVYSISLSTATSALTQTTIIALTAANHHFA